MRIAREAIWHLAEELKLDKKTKRLFSQKLQNCYLKAIDNPREIDII
jgi:hypothetical protein